MTDDKKGLLGFIATPEGQGLLATVFGGLAGARRGQPLNSIGRAGLSGLMGYGNALDRDAQAGRSAQAQAFQKMQMDRWSKEGEREDRVAALAKNFLLPGTPAVPGGIPSDIGPMPPIPATPPRFDAQGYGAALMGEAPEKGAAWFQAMQKDKPQLVTVQTPSGPMQRWLRPGETSGADVGAPVDKEPSLPWYVRRDANGMSIDPAYADLEKTKASFGRPQAQPMAPVAYMNDQGQTVWGTITDARGRPAASYSPALQGQIAGAKEQATTDVKTGAETVKAEKVSDKLLSVAKEAKSLLGKNVTESGIGAAADVAARFFGTTTEAGQNAAKLETLSGWMVANVPRMEGPQSNIDLENYRSMAGKVGDRTIPAKERIAALDALVKLQEKYKKLNQVINTPTGKTIIKTGTYGGKKVVQYSDGSTEYAD